jgi:hypothetical protein
MQRSHGLTRAGIERNLLERPAPLEEGGNAIVVSAARAIEVALDDVKSGAAPDEIGITVSAVGGQVQVHCIAAGRERELGNLETNVPMGRRGGVRGLSASAG